MSNANNMTVTVNSNKEGCLSFARFTWTFHGAPSIGPDCSIISAGFTDDEIEEIINGKAHEGADLAGYVVEVDW